MANEIEEMLVEALAQAWRKVDWRKVARGRDSLDVFQHRVKVASYQESIPKFIEKLAHGLHLQSIPVSPEIIKRLEERRSEALQKLREETIYLILLARERVREK